MFRGKIIFQWKIETCHPSDRRETFIRGKVIYQKKKTSSDK